MGIIPWQWVYHLIRYLARNSFPIIETIPAGLEQDAQNFKHSSLIIKNPGHSISASGCRKIEATEDGLRF
jgi:hypothetical protein